MKIEITPFSDGFRLKPNRVLEFVLVLAPVVQRFDSAIQRINHYPTDKY